MWCELSPCHRPCVSDRCPRMKYKRLSQPKALPNLKHKTGICKQMYSSATVGHVPRWSHTVRCSRGAPQPSAPWALPCCLQAGGHRGHTSTIKNCEMLHLAHLKSPSCQLYLCCGQFLMFQKSDHLCKTEEYFWHAEDKFVLHLMMRFSYNYHTKAVLLVF